jgi:hypothetical protein
MGELRECPFCGEDAWLKIEAGCHVRCSACCADGPVYEYADGADDPEAQIIALWNTRPDSAARNDALEEAARVADEIAQQRAVILRGHEDPEEYEDGVQVARQIGSALRALKSNPTEPVDYSGWVEDVENEL